MGTGDPPSLRLRRAKLGTLLENPGKGPERHTGRDEVEIRYPVKHCFFWIPDSRFAPSGMTDLILVLKI